MWNMDEAVVYYRSQGAPGDQTALVALLREIQAEHDGIPQSLLGALSDALGVKESFLLAVIKRIPSLRLRGTRRLELCAGPNCGKAAALAAAAEELCKEKGVELRFCNCMRLCGKGPNLKLDGKLYHKADEALLKQLLSL